jgi:hypothetical protein
MRRSKLVVVLSLLIVAAGASGGAAQERNIWKPNLAPLTAEDYWAIYQLYGEYERWLQVGEGAPDGSIRAQEVFAPDGMFVLVTPAVAGKPCSVPASSWKAGDRDLIRDTIVDHIGASSCIATLTGLKALGEERLLRGKRPGVLSRQFVYNIYIQPAPGGQASGHAPTMMRPEAGTAAKWLGGLYEDIFEKTSNGWRIKKRVWHSDEVIGAWRPNS